MTSAANSVLDAIVAATRRRVAVGRDRVPLAEIAALSERRAPRGQRFLEAISTGGPHIIAECKRRSPAKGLLRGEYDAAALAGAYAAAGVAAISVLTEPTFFDGSLDDLDAVRASVTLPVLRKDFVVDEYQLWEARLHGADAVLLIARLLAPAELAGLTRRAEGLGLVPLVEVHDEIELERAIDAGARVVGVNQRNLGTLAVADRTAAVMAPRLPRDVVAVAESGLKDAGTIRELFAMGYRAFLIGEHLMTAERPGAALRALRAELHA